MSLNVCVAHGDTLPLFSVTYASSDIARLEGLCIYQLLQQRKAQPSVIGDLSKSLLPLVSAAIKGADDIFLDSTKTIADMQSFSLLCKSLVNLVRFCAGCPDAFISVTTTRP